MNTQLWRCPTVASGAQSPGSFSTGKVSPVSRLSAMKQSRACRMRPSAAIRLPALSNRTSPGTTSLAATSRVLPSRRTVARKAILLRSCSTAWLARFSYQALRTALISTIHPTIAASSQSPTTTATTAPAIRISTNGVRICSSTSLANPCGRSLAWVGALRSRALAWAWLNPVGLLCKVLNNSLSDGLQ